MSYQVLALKYRPQTFKDVIGQEQVTQTLTNAIAGDRVSHAILFAGPRGTGKTTIARILAKAMNCMAGGPTPDPCNTCKSCTGITSGHSVDVFEIDGASNNSVDQIRELRENVTYMPAASPFKIYIIDEVHMLSQAAFNALLKTLEEPPDHVLFIFATTEAHKIPVTILSRCQRHNLGRIGLSLISGHLRELSKAENYDISTQSFDLIASEADGSMRDALSLLDRILSSTGDKTIAHDTILGNLGIIDKKMLFDISAAIINGQGEIILDLIDQVHDLGLDLKKFYGNIIKQFRNLLVTKIGSRGKSASDISENDKTVMAKMVSPLSRIYLSRVLNLLVTEESLIKSFSHTRTALEMVLLSLVQIRPGLDIDELITKLDLLAKTIGRPVSVKSESSYTPVSSRQGGVIPSAAYESRERYGSESSGSVPGKPSGKKPTKTWQGFLKTLGDSLPFISAILAKEKSPEVSGSDITIQLTGSAFDFTRIESKRHELESSAEQYYGRKINFIFKKNGKTKAEPEKSPARLRQEALNNPLVSDAIDLFNGTIVDINTKEF